MKSADLQKDDNRTILAYFDDLMGSMRNSIIALCVWFVLCLFFLNRVKSQNLLL